MLASITPVGETARGSRWSVTACAYVTGSIVGGAVLGSVFGAVGSLQPWTLDSGPKVAAGLLAIAGLAGLLADRRGLPTLRRQVNERWLTTYRGWVYGLGFGVQLGAAVTTTVTASATYVVAVGALLSGSWRTGALVGGWFGLVRALPLLATARVRTSRALRDMHRRLERWTQPMARTTSIVQGGLVIGAAMITVGVGA